MQIRFRKIQAAGNDYVYISNFDRRILNKSELAKILSDRHFGVGGDGVVFVEDSPTFDGKMVMLYALGMLNSVGFAVYLLELNCTHKLDVAD